MDTDGLDFLGFSVTRAVYVRFPQGNSARIRRALPCTS
jgi:hypothetical protein